MRAFACGHCGLVVTFESTRCVRCGSGLGFAWPQRELHAVPGGEPPRCANAQTAACNWIPDADGELCASCALTRTRPADGDERGLANLARAEGAKRRLLFELGELGLPIDGVTFDLLSSEHAPVTTGHADGVITLDLAEAEDAHRAAVREELGEPYRTLLGHLRHEIGHFYFPRLTEDPAARERARAAFGDETADYQAALDRHYAEGPPAGWERDHVSAYATMHPSEDWAETFAHLLHIRDTLQTAHAFGVRVEGPSVGERDGAPPEGLLGEWMALSHALNELNRSMGLDDLYPFVLTPAVIGKLVCVDALIAAAAGGDER